MDLQSERGIKQRQGGVVKRPGRPARARLLNAIMQFALPRGTSLRRFARQLRARMVGLPHAATFTCCIESDHPVAFRWLPGDCPIAAEEHCRAIVLLGREFRSSLHLWTPGSAAIAPSRFECR